MSDKAHFHLNGYVNKQNRMVWAMENPKVTHKGLLHPLKVTIWWAISPNGIIWPYFFEGDNRNATTVQGERYQEMNENFLSPASQERNLHDAWFDQGSATCHTARCTVQILQGL
jgi:hypothetical protein